MKKALLVLVAALGLMTAARPALAQTYGDAPHRGYPYGYGREHAYRHDDGYRPSYWYGYRHRYPYGYRHGHPHGYRYGYPYGQPYWHAYGR